MSQVNVDPEQVKNAYMACMRYQLLIRYTKSAFDRHLSEIIVDWKDDKYVRLRNILDECMVELNKPVHQLESISSGLKKWLEALNEYESISFGNTNFAVSSINSSTTKNGITNYSSPMPADYINVLNRRYQVAENNAKRAFEKYMSSIVIQSTILPSNIAPHYTSGDSQFPRGIYYNLENERKDERGEGTTFYHEVGHMIDNASTNYQGYISNNIQFANALISDANNFLVLYNSLSEDKRERLDNVLFSHSSHSLSDLISILTGGRVSGRYGHDASYWMGEGILQTEAFAHFFEASMGNIDKLELLKHVFSSAYTIFVRMLNEINGDNEEENTVNQILSRRLR